MSIVLWAQVAVFTHVISDDVDDWDRWFLGRAPRTRETLPDFRESCRVVRHSRVFRWLTSSQRTLGNGASQFKSHGIYFIFLLFSFSFRFGVIDLM